MLKHGATFDHTKQFDAQLSFIQKAHHVAPLFQRLDGIYFNSAQQFEAMNEPIKRTYHEAKGVIFQSNFNKELTFRYFGEHSNHKVIHNGADVELINNINPIENKVLDKFDNVWSCASSWRPHKRLEENINYFLEHSSENDCLVVAGNTPGGPVNDRVFYVGALDVPTLYSLYKRSKYFIHLAYLDHCPNVVVDAAACGCHVICSSSGGTKEVAVGGTVVLEDEWDYNPLELYNPPKLDFTKTTKNTSNTNIDMNYVAGEYNKFLGE